MVWWKNSTYKVAVQSQILGIKAMTSLFSHSNLKLFAHLEILKIKGCPALENVIDMEIEDIEEQQGIITIAPKDHASKKQFEFSKLLKIVFEDLQNIRSFIPAQDFTLTFPSLTLLRLHKCPQLKMFSRGKLSAPNLILARRRCSI